MIETFHQGFARRVEQHCAHRPLGALARRLSIASAIASCLAFAGLQGCSEDAPRAPRNVVLVVVDTLRADRLGVYGYARDTSPALDARAQSAAVFERAWATSSWTLPSFGSILTGEIPAVHLAGANVMMDGEQRLLKLSEDCPTLAEVLSRSGVSTAAIVNNPFLDPAYGVARGFESYDFVTADTEHARWANESVDAALRWIESTEERFFLTLHLFDLHMNYDPPDSVRGRFTAGDAELPVRDPWAIRARASEIAESEREHIRAAYDEELLALDAALERFFAELDKRGVLGETLVILTSDHGEEHFEHGGFEHGHAMHEEVLRIPLILWGPGVEPGRRTATASLVDIYPTVLRAFGLPDSQVAPVADARSLWPVRGVEPSASERTAIAEMTLYGDQAQALIRYPDKLEVNLTRGTSRVVRIDASGAPMLPSEEIAHKAELHRELERILGAAEARRTERGTELKFAETSALESLGYTGGDD